ncbi:high frequency lysogenization protein HflD [Suttonella ornithocola]|uniref:High frequency lysogenization protein HflD homolog n=1 Tax=Suttonella ornithocola TaxID=279832 RepID=A0A380MT61_9GAMM|nr:high frequency lysogenization protein HflD [Suttonella ornithocola]SUO95374.1 High frequency lysogenization protein HflD [Suttonella ornithocola]
MKLSDIQTQAWAISAMFFSADGVVSLSEKGHWKEDNFATLLPSLIRFNCENISEYYDHTANLQRGRELLEEQMSEGVPEPQLRYVLQLLHIERRLSKNTALMETLIQGLTQSSRQVEAFGLLHDNVFAKFSSLYQQTASQAARRILIKGNPRYLQDAQTVARLRTLLLCALRAAALWRANGGNRWQMLFGRKGLVDAASELSF